MNMMMMIPAPELPVSVELGRVDSPSDVLGPGGEWNRQIGIPALPYCPDAKGSTPTRAHADMAVSMHERIAG